MEYPGVHCRSGFVYYTDMPLTFLSYFIRLGLFLVNILFSSISERQGIGRWKQCCSPRQFSVLHYG